MTSSLNRRKVEVIAKPTTVRVAYSEIRDDWSFQQVATGERGEHPVAQFRRLSEEAISRIDAALVAIHGDPDEENRTS